MRRSARSATRRASGKRFARCRRSRRWTTSIQDLRYGLRMLLKHPGFTVVAALTLALGIGANTAMFSVVDAVLLRPLPYAQADRLAMVWENVNLPAYKNSRNTPSPGNFHDWRTGNSVFTDMAAIVGPSWNLTGNGDPARVDGEPVSASLFPLLQVSAALGRVFTADDDREGAGRVVLLGHGLWAERFGADPGVLGRTIHLDERTLHRGRRDAARVLLPRPGRQALGADRAHAATARQSRQPLPAGGGAVEAGGDRRAGAGESGRHRGAPHRTVPALEHRRRRHGACRCASRRSATFARRCWCCSASSASCC